MLGCKIVCSGFCLNSEVPVGACFDCDLSLLICVVGFGV